MRILALVTDGFGGHGGIARYNCDLMTALAQTPMVDRITALPRFGIGASETVVPVKVDQLRPARDPVVWSARAATIALRDRPDVVFCGHLNAAAVGTAIAKLVSSPLWLQVHGIEAWSDRGPAIRRAVEAAHLVTAVSRHTRHKLLSWSHIDPARVRVLPNTLRSTYEPGQRRPDLIERYRIEDRKVILTVGRMAAAERYKGHDRMLRCLSEVRGRVPNVSYLIVGSGDDQSRLAALAEGLGLGDSVVFAGPVADAELPDHYALADVFAMPSTGEGFGIVFVEATASALPVIGGNRDGSVDALADGLIGTLVDPDDLDGLTQAVVGALQRPSASARPSVCRFAFTNFARHVDDLVRSLALSIPPPKRPSAGYAPSMC